MAKGGRGGKRGGGMSGPGAPFSDAPDNYKIPEKLSDAIGPKGAPMSMADAYFDANPFYSSSYREFSENCQRCVMAYEMRRRGYNVEALPTYRGDQMPSNGNWQKALSGMETANVGRSTENATLNSITKQMASWGEGSRAILRLKWAGGNSGHVINCEYKNGKLYVWDAQSNSRQTGTAYLKEYLQYSTLSRTQLFRTDNATITDEMKYMVRPSKNSGSESMI